MRITPPGFTVVSTISGAPISGRMWWPIMRPCPTPSARGLQVEVLPHRQHRAPDHARVAHAKHEAEGEDDVGRSAGTSPWNRAKLPMEGARLSTTSPGMACRSRFSASRVTPGYARSIQTTSSWAPRSKEFLGR
jgi:hypothetical protein